jgi:malonate transporter
MAVLIGPVRAAVQRRRGVADGPTHAAAPCGELLRNPLIIATVLGLAPTWRALACPPGWHHAVAHRRGLDRAGPDGGRAPACSWASLARAKALGISVLTIRHLLLPLTAWLLARACGLGPAEATALILVFSALPTASSCYVLAARMGYNGAYVAGLVTLSTLLGMLSLPWACLLR